MRASWLELVDCVLRPVRPRLEPCRREGELLRVARRGIAEQRSRALDDCQRRIEQARAVVFAADDGIIPAGMTDLEREWRALSHSDPDHGLMDLWASIAPSAWLDRKRWRDSDPAGRLDAAITLAADVPGVEAAESAVEALTIALRAWGRPIGSRVRWRALEADTDCVSALLEGPLRVARESIATRDAAPIMLKRARQLELAVQEAASARFPERPLLVRSLAFAAFVDCALHAASIAERPNPVTPLCTLWRAGYALAIVDASGVTLELPPLA